MREGWAEASAKNDSDPLGLNGAPEWVLNAWVECCKVVFPGGLPAADQWDAKAVGEIFGRLYGLQSVLAGEVPLGPETQAAKDKLKAAAKTKPPLKNAKALKTDVLTKLVATHAAIPLATALATSAAYSDALRFQKGLARGLEIKSDELAASRTFERHTRTYLALSLSWRACMNCRSLKHIHEQLCAAVGESRIGNFKTFEKVCQKIGLSVRPRGRPRQPG